MRIPMKPVVEVYSEGGSGFSTSNVVTGIVKDGETISAGKFVELINSNDQTPKEISAHRDDKFGHRRYAFKIADGKFVVFYDYTTESSYSRTKSNCKAVSIFTVGSDQPVLNASSTMSNNHAMSSTFWVDELSTGIFAVATFELDSVWKIVIRKCIINATNNNITWSDICSIDVSSVFPTSSFNATYRSQGISAITMSSLGDGDNIIVLYGANGNKTLYYRIVETSTGTIGSEGTLTLQTTPMYTSWQNNTTNETWSYNGDCNLYRSLCYDTNKIVFRYRAYTGDVFILLTVSGTTATITYENNNGIKGYGCYLRKISSTKFAYYTISAGNSQSTNAYLYLFEIINDTTLQYVSISLPVSKLCGDVSFVESAISIVNSNTLFILTLTYSSTINPYCITMVDFSDYNNPYVSDYIELQIISSGTASTFDAFITDNTSGKGLFLYSKGIFKTQTSGSWYTFPLYYCGINITNNTVLPSGSQPVFTQNVKKITGVSKTSASGGEEIEVYLPDVQN